MAEPSKRIKVGSVTLSVWENTIKKGDETIVIPSMTINKSYKDADGTWQNSTSFKYTELFQVIMACQKALEEKYIKAEVAIDDCPV